MAAWSKTPHRTISSTPMRKGGAEGSGGGRCGGCGGHRGSGHGGCGGHGGGSKYLCVCALL